MNNLKNNSIEFFQNICPRNCFCSCGIRTIVKDNKIIDIEGDGNHPFTKGKLCAKGYTFINQVYHPQRVLYPMQQVKRGSNKWERINWEKAINLIAEKIVEIITKYKSTLPIFFDGQSGNRGLLTKSLELLFNYLGSFSKFGNILCDAAGKGAHLYTFGSVHNPDPEDMLYSRYIIIWGGNPAWTCFQQTKIINEARDKGAKIVVIDPIQTATSVSADMYIRIKPGTDGALALGMIKYIIDNNLYDFEFIENYVKGWEIFKSYVENNVSLAWASEISGVNVAEIINLANNYALTKPAVIWQGFGAQRYENGGQNYRIINTLAAITGNIGYKGTGIYYADARNILKLYKSLYDTKEQVNQHRAIKISDFTIKQQPPIEMAFFIASNPLAQYPATMDIKSFFEELDFIVTVDQFLTKTAEYSDLLLPSASFFEKPDIIASYWHKYIGYNQRAIYPLGESKSELEIANLLASRLNKLLPGVVNFNINSNEDEFLEKSFTVLMKDFKGVDNFSQFKAGGYFKLKNDDIAWYDNKFLTPSGKFEIISERAEANGLPIIPSYLPAKRPGTIYPYRLLTVHSELFLNSQFSNIDVLQTICQGPKVLINPVIASKLLISQRDEVRIYNQQGEVILTAEITKTIGEDILVCVQGEQINGFTVNNLIEPLTTDMGNNFCNYKGIAYHDTFVNISKV